MGVRDPEPTDRLEQRVTVGQRRAEMVCPPSAKSRRKLAKEVRRPVVILDASTHAASVYMAPPNGVPPSPGQTFVLVLDGKPGTVRIQWVKHLTDDSDEGFSLLCGVEFTDSHPAFLPTIRRWLDEEKTAERVLRPRETAE
jgi:hypothetical protein